MKYDSFSEDLEVRYADFVGRIRFICHDYVTLCIGKEQRDICILVYPDQWKDIELFKQSTK